MELKTLGEWPNIKRMLLIMYIIKYCKQEARMNTVLYSQANNPRLFPGQIFVDGGSLGSV